MESLCLIGAANCTKMLRSNKHLLCLRHPDSKAIGATLSPCQALTPDPSPKGREDEQCKIPKFLNPKIPSHIPRPQSPAPYGIASACNIAVYGQNNAKA
jgi:hypothetical protein